MSFSVFPIHLKKLPPGGSTDQVSHIGSNRVTYSGSRLVPSELTSTICVPQVTAKSLVPLIPPGPNAFSVAVPERLAVTLSFTFIHMREFFV